MLAIVGNVFVPQIGTVVRDHAAPILPSDSPSALALQRMGKTFGDSGSNNLTYIVLESDRPLGDPERAFYNQLITKLKADKAHVDSVIELWNDPLSASVAQSRDSRAVYVLVRLSGQLGTTEAAASVAAVRQTVAHTQPPPGLQTYVTGPGPTVSDELISVDSQVLINIIATGVVIALLLYAMYRSVMTSRIPLLPVAFALAVARPLVALLGQHGLVELSLFSENLLASITLGAVTNYGIFLVGRYHEYRRQGVIAEEALTLAYRSVAPVVVASALTVALALASLNFARVGLLRSAGIPCAISLSIGLVAAITVLPALLELAARRGMAEPRSRPRRRRWRRIGVAVARWPGPVAITALSILLILAAPIITTRISFNETLAEPASTESNRGYAAMDRHYPANRILPEIVMVEADHDLRSPSGLIAIDRITRKILEIPDVVLVQSATRPAGVPLPDSQISTQAGTIADRLGDSANQITQWLGKADDATASLTQMSASVDQLQAGLTRGGRSLGALTNGTADLADGIHHAQGYLATASQYLDPLRSYAGSDPNCSAEPVCSAIEKALHPVDVAVSSTNSLATGVDHLADGTHGAQAAVTSASKSLADIQKTLTQARGSLSQLVTTLNGIKPQIADLTDYANGLSASFRGTGEGGFYLPQEALNDARFHRVAQLLFSEDGRATRLLVFGSGEVFGSAGAQLSEQIRTAAAQSTKDGVLAGSTISVAGVGSVVHDLQIAVKHDFAVLAITSLLLVLMVVIVLLRSPIAGGVVVITVALSYISAIAVSSVFWRMCFGCDLHWAVPPISFIALVAVGADYNLLLCARLKEECAVGGIKTGMIRAFEGTGVVVTSAGLVFALTMFALVRSDIRSIAQIGTTIGLGLLIDTFIVRSFAVPAIAGLFGRWFWWPFRLRDAKTGLRTS
jgi:RND superfamily putative drug exporter